MTNLVNFIKRLFRLFRKEEKCKLSVEQIDELIELNKDVLIGIGDDADYDGMGDWGRFPPIKKKK
tara:strand:- start:1006 stop:1200 length:195 start_codon:yes stop_codon:yes gene_type:complete